MITDWSTPAAVALLLVVALLGFFVTLTLVRRRESVWQQFARRHGLRFEHGDAGPRVSGTIDGRPFELSTRLEGSDAEELGVAEIRMTLALRGPLPEGLQVAAAEGLIGAVARMLEAERIEIGEERFDHEALVKGAEPDACRQYLTPQRREALLALIEASGQAKVGLENGCLFWEDRELLSSLDELDRCLARLRKTAPALDG